MGIRVAAGLLAGGAVLVVVAGGCAPAAGSDSTAQSASDNQAAANAAARQQQQDASTGQQADQGGADCTKATKTTIGTDYTFSPAKLTIQRGGFIAVVNKSDVGHALVTEPDAGIVTSVVDEQERQVIQFPDAGKFTVESADTKHRAVLQVTVAGESGCGKPSPTLTISGGGISPGKATVKATANFVVRNATGTAKSVTCTPGSDGDHTKLEKGESQILALDEPGDYTCKAGTASVKVTVTGK